MHDLVQSILFHHFMYIHVHGAVSRMVNAMVASSSSAGGSGTLHQEKKTPDSYNPPYFPFTFALNSIEEDLGCKGRNQLDRG